MNRSINVGLSALLYFGSVAVHAQSAPPAFEVATVRPSGSNSPPMSLRREPGGRLVTSNTPLTFLVAWAFDLDEGRVVGGPKGADTARFDIVTKAPTENPVAGQTQLMLRTLLADRFGLVAHPEKRNRSGYALIIDGGGPKVTLANPPEPPDTDPFSMTTPGVLRGRHVTGDMLAKALSSQLGTPVENMTRMTGSFDFTLTWRPDVPGASDDATRASLFTAIREQLGLRLDARTLPVDVIVIDRLSLTPTPN